MAITDSQCNGGSEAGQTAKCLQSFDGFFNSVEVGKYPAPCDLKSQPWKLYQEVFKPTDDGKRVVAVPKKCDYGSNSGLGGS